MITIMLATSNRHEEKILQMAFKQRDIDLLVFQASFGHYVKMLQYVPDIILLEFPRNNSEQLNFVKLIRKHKRLQKIPIFGYGNKIDSSIRNGLMAFGVNEYFERPLKFTVLMEHIEIKLKQMNKVISDKKEDKKEEISDTSLLLDSSVLPTKKINIMVEHVAKLMAFPFTITKVLKLADDQKSGAVDLAKIIEADPVISTDILKVSNTVFFASAGKRISSIKNAIIRIGFRETKKIVMSMAVMQLFDKEDNNFGFDRIDFWYHSLTTALVAEKLAKQIGKINPQDAFLTGLLHDFGIILLDSFFSEIFSKLIEKTTDEAIQFTDAEKLLTVVTHNDALEELFTKWKMPQHIVDAILMQHDFNSLKENLDTDANQLALCVALGNILAKSITIGKECDQFVFPVDNWFFSQLKMPAGYSKDFIEKLYSEVSTYRQFLGLEERDFSCDCCNVDNKEENKIGILNVANDIFIPIQYHLKKDNINVKLILPSTEPKNLDAQFTLIIIWTNLETSADNISPYLNIKKYSSDTDNNDELVKFLICTDNPKLPKEIGDRNNIFFMSQSTDIRQFDENIQKIFADESVIYKHYKPVIVKSVQNDNSENNDSNNKENATDESQKKSSKEEKQPDKNSAKDKPQTEKQTAKEDSKSTDK